MNFARTTTALALLAAIASTAHADPATTRDQTKAEFLDAVRRGDVYAAGDSGMKLNELYPQRYPRTVSAAPKTRAEVKAELAEAMRDGTMVAAGEGGLALREELPQRYPAVAVAVGRSRADVKAETREAIRTGDMFAAGEGLKFNEEHPRRSTDRATYTAQAGATQVAASGPVR